MKWLSVVAVAGVLIIYNASASSAFDFGSPVEITNAVRDAYETNKDKLIEKDFVTVDKKVEESIAKASGIGGWKLRGTVVVPIFKIYESKNDSRKLDVAVNSGIGGGLSLVWYKDVTDKNSRKLEINPADGNIIEVIDVKTESYFSFSPFTVLMSNGADESNINMSWATTFGFFNNTLMLGAGYDFGEVVDRSRWFGLLSIGATF